MDSILSLCLGIQIRQNENGLLPFSLDEALAGTRNVFETRAYDAYLETVFSGLDAQICKSILGKFTDAGGMLKNLLRDPCCECLTFENAGQAKRKVSTSLCEVRLHATRVRCIGCGKSFVPLFYYLGLRPRQNKSNELVQKAVEVVVDQSYRRGQSHLHNLTATKMSLGQLWRTVMKNDFFDINIGKKDLNSSNFRVTMDLAIKGILLIDPLHAILADGTGFKLQRVPLDVKIELKKQGNADSKFIQKERPLQSEVRIIYGITKSEILIPLGVYADKESWKKIGNDIYSRFGKNKNLKQEPIAEVLIADGEDGLFRGLKKLARTEQRCQWHFTHDFKAVFQYQDNGSKTERKIYQSEAQSTMDTLHEKIMTTENLTDDKKLELEAEIIIAEETMKKLANKLRDNQFYKAEGYTRNAVHKLFTYLRHYLKTGFLGAKVTSQLERFMREVGRRIKKIAWNWSPRGAAILCYLILVKTMNRTLWENYWKKILRVGDNLKMEFEYAFMKNQEEKLLH